MLKVIFFDYDGTIRDSFDAVLYAYNRIFESLGRKQISKKQFREIFINDWKTFEKKLAIPESAGKLWNNFYNKHKPRLFPDILDVFQALQKTYRLGIISNGNRQRLIEELSLFGIDNIFKLLVTSDDAKNLKPDPELLLKGMEKLSIDASEVVYVGDTTDDILFAKNAKVKCIAVTWGFHTKAMIEKENPDAIVDKPEDIVETINHM